MNQDQSTSGVVLTPSCSALNVGHITVYHVLCASTGEQIFEDGEESIAKSRALEFVAARVDEPHNNGPVTIWRTGDIRKPNAKLGRPSDQKPQDSKP